jgi:hypothetical protein
MHVVRPAIAADPRRFGRGVRRDPPAGSSARGLGDDFKLFAMTFAAGFLFVSVLLA